LADRRAAVSQRLPRHVEGGLARHCVGIGAANLSPPDSPSNEEIPMKKVLYAASLLALGLLSSPVFAANASCDAQATEKKLAGAAKTSFLKKCEADAGGSASCDAQATEKKLAGAAKTSFVKKCTADAGGAAPMAAASAAAPSAAAGCDKQAADKKLAGAAKTSFVKKCSADAASAPKP
jgi:hypothetical protein